MEVWELEVAGVVVGMAGVTVAKGATVIGDVVVAMAGMAEGNQGDLKGMVVSKA